MAIEPAPPFIGKLRQRKTDESTWGITWGSWMADWIEDDTVVSSTWEVETGLTKVAESFDDTTTLIKITGGNPGSRYAIINRIVTAEGEKKGAALEVTILGS